MGINAFILYTALNPIHVAREQDNCRHLQSTRAMARWVKRSNRHWLSFSFIVCGVTTRGGTEVHEGEQQCYMRVQSVLGQYSETGNHDDCGIGDQTLEYLLLLIERALP